MTPMPKNAVTITGVDETLRRLALLQLAVFGEEARAFLRSTLYMEAVTTRTFEELAFGGDYRGVHWDHFAEESIGSKRPSGAIIDEDTPILWDTGTLAKEAVSVIERTPTRVDLGPVGPAAAYGPFQQEARPFLFIQEGVDDREIGSIFAEEAALAWQRKQFAILGALTGAF